MKEKGLLMVPKFQDHWESIDDGPQYSPNSIYLARNLSERIPMIFTLNSTDFSDICQILCPNQGCSREKLTLNGSKASRDHWESIDGSKYSPYSIYLARSLHANRDDFHFKFL